MTGGDKLSFSSGKGRIIDQNSHSDCRRIDVHKLQRRAFLAISQRFADKNFFKAGESNDVTRTSVFDFHLLQSGVSEKGCHSDALAFSVTLNATDRMVQVHWH